MKVKRLSADLAAALASGAGLVVPSAQRQVALRAAWGRAQAAQGVRVWSTPRVDSLGQYIDRRLREHWSQGGEADRLLPPVAEWAALRELRREHGGTAEARALLNSIRVANDWGIDARQLGDSPEAVILRESAAELQRLRAAGGLRPAREWLDEIPMDSRPWVAAGFLTLPPRQRALFDRLGMDRIALSPMTSAPFELARADDDAHEIELIAAWCRRELEQDPSRRLLIVDSRLRERRRQYETTLSQTLNPSHWLTSEAREFSTVFAIEGGQSLAEFPLVARALLTLRLLTGQLRFEELVTWLRMPFFAGEDEFVGAQVERILREGRRLEYRASEVATAIESARNTAPSALELAQSLRRAANEIAGAQRAPSEWARVLQDALRLVGWPGARVLRSDEQQTVQRWHALLDEFSALGAWVPRADAAAAVATLADLASDRQFDPASVDAALTLTDAHDDPLVHYDGIWVAGLDATQWPPPARPDVFIPTSLQRAAGIPWATAKGQAQVARDSFTAWRSRTDALHCSWGALDGDAHRTVSPLLSRVGVATDYPPAASFRSLASRWLGAESEPVSDDAGVPWNLALPVGGGVRPLELQAECGFHAYAEQRLDAHELEEPEPGIDPRDRGKLLHRALQNVWQRLGNHFQLMVTVTDEAVLKNVIDEDVAAAVRHVFPRDVPADLGPAVERESFRLKQLIAALLKVESGRPEFDVVDTEVKRDVLIQGGRFEMRIDRVDKLQGGGFAILDYKSGLPRAPRWDADRVRNPQLLAYLYAEGKRPVDALANVFLTHNTAKFKGKSTHTNLLPGVSGVGKANDDPEVVRARWEALRRQWLGIVERLADDYLAGVAHVEPAPDVCRLCPLTILCRRLEGVVAIEDDGEGDD